MLSSLACPAAAVAHPSLPQHPMAPPRARPVMKMTRTLSPDFNGGVKALAHALDAPAAGSGDVLRSPAACELAPRTSTTAAPKEALAKPESLNPAATEESSDAPKTADHPHAAAAAGGVRKAALKFVDPTATEDSKPSITGTPKVAAELLDGNTKRLQNMWESITTVTKVCVCLPAAWIHGCER